MTTNQTIDGVPRRICHACVTLARNAYCPVCDDTPAAQPHGEEFSAVGWSIDHTAGRPILVHNNCSVIEAEQAYGVLELIRKSEQPQDEPVAWRSCAAINGKHYITEDSPDQQQERIDKSEPGAYLLASQPLYLGPPEQPAPVAVVLPTQQDFERFIIRRDGSVNVSVLGKSRFYNDATIDREYFVWLTCLDEVTRLNPSL